MKTRSKPRTNGAKAKPKLSASTRESAPTARARYIMIGGFLGAGKTTAVSRLAQQLSAGGQRVGLITNDQGSELVDTAMLRSRGFATEEIPGGCFCCRFNSLVDAANKLKNNARPDVFIAEPVGSCTDLVATVTYPLRRMYGTDFDIAPLSVLVDPIRALRILGLEEGGKFSEKVLYIYGKQLEEADLIVINKCDLLSEARLKELRNALQSKFPDADLFEISARTGTGLGDWFARITKAVQGGGDAMDVDYAVYADGEALLGWLNCTIRIESTRGIDGNKVLTKLASSLQKHLENQNAEVAHLKMTLSPDSGLGDIAVINLVRNDFVPELSQTLENPVTSGEIILNLRAEAAPELLRAAVDSAMGALGKSMPKVRANLEHLEHFRPGKPQPTHRDLTLKY